MFDDGDGVVGFLSGEGAEDDFDWDVDAAFRVTCGELADGWVGEDRQVVPVLDSLLPGPFLAVVLEYVDRSKLNGFDLVEVLKARERLISHFQAGSVADTHVLAYAAPGDAGSDPGWLPEAFVYASDELRPALSITRRAAENRMSLAFDLKERLPGVWEMLSAGLVDLPRARVICDGTAHLDVEEARQIVEFVAERASRLTTGQLAAWIRRLCVESDPGHARRRYETAVAERRLVIEPTVDGTAHIHILDVDILDARAVGRRVNGHMISLRNSGDRRAHDNLRADIAVDLLVGTGDISGGGRPSIEMRVSVTTLAGLDDKAAEIPGMGPVIADIARRFADRHHDAEWRTVITDDNDQLIDVVTTRRRPNKAISDLVEATQPVCAFPGCRMPASACDFDHLTPWSRRGETSTRNGGPKCRHDHTLRDHGWKHQRIEGRDHWTSPHGHTYTTEKPP